MTYLRIVEHILRLETAENGNNYNVPSENVQENGKDIGNITDQRATKQSEHSITTSPMTSTSPAPPGTKTEASQVSQTKDARTQPTEHDLPMPEELEDGLDTVSEKKLEPFQKQSNESFNPIISIQDFFSNDILLENHSIDKSPCFHIINTKPGELPTDTVYYCKLHPDMIPSTFLQAIELHCRKEPDIHKAEILRIMERDTAQRGESA
ncbi:MAG: hypothetical protein WBZ36_13695 [Candidatus Nitrosopolaris sp.]